MTNTKLHFEETACRGFNGEYVPCEQAIVLSDDYYITATIEDDLEADGEKIGYIAIVNTPYADFSEYCETRDQATEWCEAAVAQLVEQLDQIERVVHKTLTLGCQLPEEHVNRAYRLCNGECL